MSLGHFQIGSSDPTVTLPHVREFWLYISSNVAEGTHFLYQEQRTM